jgi:hypothetical protein
MKAHTVHFCLFDRMLADIRILKFAHVVYKVKRKLCIIIWNSELIARSNKILVECSMREMRTFPLFLLLHLIMCVRELQNSSTDNVVFITEFSQI